MSGEVRDSGWFKSSSSSGASENCVEVRVTPALVRIRDTKNRIGPEVHFAPDSWDRFLRFGLS